MRFEVYAGTKCNATSSFIAALRKMLLNDF